MTERVKRLLETMCLSEHEGVLVYNPSNMFYLSGYTGEGLVLAEAQAPGFEVLMTGNNKSHEEIVGELCAAQGIDTLYYEDDYITVRTMEKCRASIHGVEWKTVGAAVELLREQKDEHELALIAEACRITGDAFERILPNIKEGMTEKELALMLDFDMMTHGASKPSFSTIVAAGANGSLPHAVPGDYKLRRGDMITMDFGARYGNYCADMTRTVALGQPSDEMKKVYGIVLEAQKMAQDAVAAVLKPGQVMTVEPGIYLPGVGGVRIENSVVVREGGCEVLTKPTRELIIL